MLINEAIHGLNDSGAGRVSNAQDAIAALKRPATPDAGGMV